MDYEVHDALTKLERIRSRKRLAWGSFQLESPEIAKPLDRALDAMRFWPPKPMEELPAAKALRDDREPWLEAESWRTMRPAELEPSGREQGEPMPWQKREPRWW